MHVPLHVATLEYASAMKHLPAGATLKEAVNFFHRRSPAKLETRTVRQVVDEMLAAKRAADLEQLQLGADGQAAGQTATTDDLGDRVSGTPEPAVCPEPVKTESEPPPQAHGES